MKKIEILVRDMISPSVTLEVFAMDNGIVHMIMDDGFKRRTLFLSVDDARILANGLLRIIK